MREARSVTRAGRTAEADIDAHLGTHPAVMAMSRIAPRHRDGSSAGLRDTFGASPGEGAVQREECGREVRLRTGPCRALGADTPRDSELRGDLARRRLGSERKYVKRSYARDTGKTGRQFAR